MWTSYPTLPRTATLSLEERLRRCATPMTKFTLFNALTGSATKAASTISINGIPVILSSIQREDGSGSSFNLAVYGPDNCLYKCYCRTSD
jgi:hypothetical protein